MWLASLECSDASHLDFAAQDTPLPPTAEHELFQSFSIDET